MINQTISRIIKAIATTLICTSLISNNSIAQVVFIVKYKSEADAILFETSYKGEADIIIYKSDYKTMADDSEGIWFITNYMALAEWKVYITEFRTNANCLVYFTKNRGLATPNTCFLESRNQTR